MTTATRRQILESVAAGELDPADAARLLAALEQVEQSGADSGADGPAGSGDGAGSGSDSASAGGSASVADARSAAPVGTPSGGVVGQGGGRHVNPRSGVDPLEGALTTDGPRAGVSRLMVQATSRRVRVVGDPTVAVFDVEGPHSLRRDGSVLHVSGEVDVLPSQDTFSLLSGGRWREVADRVASVGSNLELVVRVNPDLPVGVEVIAGTASVSGLHALDHVRLTGGSLRIDDAVAPLDLLVQAGSAQVAGRFTHGQSRLRCESGTLQVALAPGTDARIRTDVQLGRLSVQPPPSSRQQGKDIVVGTGSAEVDVQGVMAAVTVVHP